MEDERQALLEFKHGLIDKGDRLASWDSEESDCCRWAGIVCDNTTRHVHQIHLPGLDGHCLTGDFRTFKKYNEASKQRFRGNLSSSLLRLKQLRHLDISCNNFERIQIPSFIGSLQNLRYLNLSNSEFGGIIPPQLGNLSELQILCLGSFHAIGYSESTSISSMQWLSSLRMLQHVDMSNVDLREIVDWLHVINTLPSLVQLHFSGCRLTHIHPNVLSLNITSLSLLDISDNHFRSFMPPWIFSITNLVSLDLYNCGIHSLTPGSKDGFHNLTSLEFLSVYGNGFMNSSFLLKGLSSNLISLDISYCGISSPVLDSLHNLTSLRSLDLSGNRLTKTIPKSLGNLCNLIDLYISDMKSLKISLMHLLDGFFECKAPALESLFLTSLGISGHLPDQLGRLIHLRHLKLDFNQISGVIPDSIGRLSSLRTLSLPWNQISGPIPFSIGELSLLEVLDLKENYFIGFLPESIGRLSSLDMLDISDNELNGSIPDILGPLSRLLHLDLSYNFLTGPIPNSIGRLTSLERLYLKNNQFTKSFPKSIGNLSSLEELDLSSNQLEGGLPDSIGQLSSLEGLNLAHNRLNGSVPDSIVQLSKLERLHLQYNFLTGPIPNSVGRLSSLEMLDLSNNRFTISLPIGLRNLHNLNVLNVHNNLLNGSVTGYHFSNLKKLGEIRAENNRLTLHLSIDNWVPPFQLEILRIGSWNLGPYFPSWLQSQRNLRDLDISNTGISDILPSWFWSTFQDIGYLNMSHNDIKGMLIGDLSTFEPSAAVDLSNNHFEGPLPAKFSEVDLLYLDVSNNHLSGSLDQFLCFNRIMSRPLQALDLANNNLSGAIPDCWQNWGSLNLNRLQILELSENEFTGSIPLLIGREETKLKLLSLRSNNLEGAIPDELCGLTQIQILDLAHNSLSGTLPTCFYNFSTMSEKQNMSVIEQSHGIGSAFVLPTERGSPYDKFVFDFKVQVVSLVIKGSEYEYSTNLFLVTALDLSGREETKLKLLSLRSNNLEGAIPDELCGLTQIQILDLAHNSLSGTLPTCFYNFSTMSEKQNMSVIEQSHGIGSAFVLPTERGSPYDKFVFDFKVQVVSLVIKGSEYEYSTNLFLVTALDLSGNQFSGPIPEDLMSLAGLRYMNLSGNHLKGRIPEEIGKMTSLESLDISLNQLNGRIPWSISGLSSLSSLNVSFNKLTGEIPTSTQLQSLNESSFLGNALCGPPLVEQCNKKRSPPDAESTPDLSSNGQNWGLIISIVLGFIIGFWAVIAPLIASKVWRSVYFYFLYKAWFKIRVVCCNHRHG
ncbi:LRR receptor-like serine/threonine-protein kinase GSO2 [Artemisia annua]|uniref:LRR receptor-like serine/threonine-protein kinase GSO2 n=1 Tax=Artemisia annua TaxID=35608 RepID=A0A2U1MCN3_ARTAN|nr:LRR receptor-like serine/threonine-protein kinase GSO2 [Artemisia annua]